MRKSKLREEINNIICSVEEEVERVKALDKALEEQADQVQQYVHGEGTAAESEMEADTLGESDAEEFQLPANAAETETACAVDDTELFDISHEESAPAFHLDAPEASGTEAIKIPQSKTT